MKKSLSLEDALEILQCEFPGKFAQVDVRCCQHMGEGCLKETRWSVYVDGLGYSEDKTNLTDAIISLKDRNGLIEYEKQAAIVENVEAE